MRWHTEGNKMLPTEQVEFWSKMAPMAIKYKKLICALCIMRYMLLKDMLKPIET
jgi:hypothetical protein